VWKNDRNGSCEAQVARFLRIQRNPPDGLHGTAFISQRGNTGDAFQSNETPLAQKAYNQASFCWQNQFINTFRIQIHHAKKDIPMPMHDWSRVTPGIYHNFNYRWIAAIIGTKIEQREIDKKFVHPEIFFSKMSDSKYSH